MLNFEEYLNQYFDNIRQCEITEAMKYACAGGKRFRPNILFSILKGYGLEEETGYDAALALEMIQTYSLIHDDLPAMDNDDMRRGKPSLHKAFREDIAILAGDELLTESFGVIANSKEYDYETKVNLISLYSKYAGLGGMVYGQLLDVSNSSKTINKENLFEIQDNKTGGLFKIACLASGYIGKTKKLEYFLKLGSLIGELFQNQDDLFDLIKSEEETGKKKSDLINDKGSALCLYSKEELSKLIDEEYEYLLNYLKDSEFDNQYLLVLLKKLKNR